MRGSRDPIFSKRYVLTASKTTSTAIAGTESPGEPMIEGSENAIVEPRKVDSRELWLGVGRGGLRGYILCSGMAEAQSCVCNFGLFSASLGGPRGNSVGNRHHCGATSLLQFLGAITDRFIGHYSHISVSVYSNFSPAPVWTYLLGRKRAVYNSPDI
jgi:hypothetical protein